MQMMEIRKHITLFQLVMMPIQMGSGITMQCLLMKMVALTLAAGQIIRVLVMMIKLSILQLTSLPMVTMHLISIQN